MTSERPEHPSAAPLVIRVGVTGHRLNALKRDEFSEDLLRVAIRSVLEIVRETAGQIAADQQGAYATGEAPILRLISPLAEGADRYVAQEALKLGYELQSPFPFPRQEYEKDFKSAESREEFENLQTFSTAVLELDGSRDAEAEAYEAVGRTVLRQSDILIAVWNGNPPEGLGGTGQIVQEALSLEVPVVRIDSRQPHAVSLLGTRGAPESSDLSLLPQHLRRIFLPPSEKELTAALGFFEERQPQWTLGFFFKLFCKAWIWSASRPQIRVGDFYETAESNWRETWKILADVETGSEPRVSVQVKTKYLEKFAWADGLAELYAGKYRSSFTVTYLMGALAILFAYLAAKATDGHHGQIPWFLVVELTLIVSIIYITRHGRKRRWHERWMDYRSLAEGLRYMAFLSLFGHVTSSFQVPAHLEGGDPRTSWFNWYFRAVVRHAGLIRAHFDGSYVDAYRRVLAQAIHSQIEYHTVNARRFHTLHRRLHRVAVGLFILTAAACILHIIPALCNAPERLLNALQPGLFPFFEEALSFCAIVLPAFGGAIGAISHQGEFDRIALRSHALKEHLETCARELYCLGERPSSRDLSLIATEFTNLALAELVDWRFVFLGKELTLPA